MRVHWFGYVVIAFAVLACVTAVYAWRCYGAYRRAWTRDHLDELVRVLDAFKAMQVSRFRAGACRPSLYSSPAGVALGYSISWTDQRGDRRVRHQLVAESGGFFGQVLAERILSCALARLGFDARQVELWITAYSFDSFHAMVHLTESEHQAWVEAPLVALPADRSALVEAREYRAQLGHPRQLLKLPPAQYQPNAIVVADAHDGSGPVTTSAPSPGANEGGTDGGSASGARAG